MKPGDPIMVGGLELRFVKHPWYSDAHPGDASFEGHVLGVCENCAIAERVDTGERVLLWLAGGINWGISRNGMNAETHRRDAYEIPPFSRAEFVGA